MKRNLRYILPAGLLAIVMTGCLDESFPENYSTSGQIANADKSGLSNAISSYMIDIPSTASTYGNYSNIGYPGLMIWRDVMCNDLPIVSTGFEYFTWYADNTYLGNYQCQSDFWEFFYAFVQKSNLLIGVSDMDNPDDAADLANAFAHRAMAYMDMTRWYEFKHTGFADLDSKAESRGIYKLTVPIVTEDTSEADGFKNPRAPFYEMFRFILTDLNNAERLMAGNAAAYINKASAGAIYGLKARFYLDLATRFEIYPEDLVEQLEHEADEKLDGYDPIGVSSANDCWRLAAEYARKAISQGYTPVTKSQWFDPVSGFNTANNSWMWAMTYSADDDAVTSYTWMGWVSYMCPEADYGISSSTYNGCRMIDAALFSTIPDSDWRKATWIDPDDFNSDDSEQIFEEKYSAGTLLSYEEWCSFSPYVGFKFHPGSGDRSASIVGNKVSIPMMRVEEMYLIEAEAVAHTQGVGAGRTLLESFVNQYRYTDGSYRCQASDIDGFTDEVLRQKRIEFWGEGIVMSDYKRLEKAVTRGYEGTNFPEAYRLNTYDGYVAPWMNVYIPDSEMNRNTAVVGNPDPSMAVSVWK